MILRDTDHNGFPVVVSKESQYLVGFVLRRDLNLALGSISVFVRNVKIFVCTLFIMLKLKCFSDYIPLLICLDLTLLKHIFIKGNAVRNQEGIVSNSKVYFTSHVPVNTMVGGPTPLKMKKILDMVRS